MSPGAVSPPIRFGERVRTLTIGIAFLYAANKLFDYVLYPYVVFRAGILAGGGIMTALSALTCLAGLKYYDRSKRDWLGIETIRDLRDSRGGGRVGRLAAWILHRSDPAAFVALSLWYDPFITTVWLRHERFGGMAARDHRIFWGSVLLANAFWTLSCWLGVNLFVWGWNHARG